MKGKYGIIRTNILAVALLCLNTLAYAETANNNPPTSNQPADSNHNVFEIIKQETAKPVAERQEHLQIDHAKNTNIANLNRTAQPSTNAAFNISASDYTTPPERFEEIVQKAYEAVQVGQLEAALALYKKARALDPNNPSLLYAMGTIYHKRRQLDQASQLYKEVLIHDPSNHKALTNYLTILATKDPKGALQELLSLEQINNQFAPVLGQIGLLYAEKRQYHEAISYLQRAIALTPNELYYMYNLAVVYDQKGEYRKARQLYMDIIERSKAYNLQPPISIAKLNQRVETLAVL